MRNWYEDPVVWGAGLMALIGGSYYIVSKRGGDIADVPFIGPVIAPIAGKGSRLTDTDLSHGIVSDSPEYLASQASIVAGFTVAVEDYALARMIRSEGAAQGEVRGHVALNDLSHLGWESLLYLLTYSTDPARKGSFGEQFAPADNVYPHKMVRRYSTARDPYESDLRLALKVQADHAVGIDPTGGAIKFLDRSSMGVQAGSGSADDKIAEWEGEGLISYTLDQYGDDLVLFKRG